MITVILISGPSGSGKSTLANSLETRIALLPLPPSTSTDTNNTNTTTSNITATTTTTCIVVHQDDYFTMPFLPYNERKDDDLSYESHEGIDWLQMKKDIQTTIATDVTTDADATTTDADADADAAYCTKHHEHVIIVEGHMLGAARDMFHDMDTYNGMGYSQYGGANDAQTMQIQMQKTQIQILSVLISCPMEICRQRRLSRRSRSDSETLELKHYFDQSVWPGFVQFGRPAMQALRNGIDTSTSSMSSSTTYGDTCEGILTSSVVEISTEHNDCFESNLIRILQSSLFDSHSSK